MNRLEWSDHRAVRQVGVADAAGLGPDKGLPGAGREDVEFLQHQRLAEPLGSVASSIAYFQQSMEKLGIARNVTLFTASDFGCALLSNGDGSDHGWGGHHFIVGGAVRGGKVYGQFPDVALNTTTNVGNGRRLPTTAVDQYAATLARWMGVPDADLPLVLPNIGNFNQRNLGFMAAS